MTYPHPQQRRPPDSGPGPWSGMLLPPAGPGGVFGHHRSGGVPPDPPTPPRPPGRPPLSPRGKVLAAIAALVVVAAVVAIVVFNVGGHGQGRVGPFGHVPAPRSTTQVGQTVDGVVRAFVVLETRRYNAGPPDSPPDATRTSYGAVSCRADLALMPASGPPLPPVPAHPRYTFQPEPLQPTTGGRQLLMIDRTDTHTGEVGTGLFYVQREGMDWRVCGLYPSTQPPPEQAGGAAAGSGPTATGLAPSATQDLDTPQGTVASFAAAVQAGQADTVVSDVCLNGTVNISTVQDWTTAHAQVRVEAVETSSSQMSSARIQVSESGQPTATVGLLLQQQSGLWCIDDLEPLH